MNKFYYDIEIIVTWKVTTPNLSFVHRWRGIHLDELNKLLEKYDKETLTDITINIRGVNY